MLFSDSYLILVLLFGSVAQWRLVVGLHSHEMPRCCDVDLFDQCCHVDNRLAVSRRVHEGVAEDVHSSQRHSRSELHAQSGQCAEIGDALESISFCGLISLIFFSSENRPS